MVKKYWSVEEAKENDIVRIEEYEGKTFWKILAIFTVSTKNWVKVLKRKRMREDVKEDFAYGKLWDRATYIKGINKELTERLGVTSSITPAKLYENKPEMDVYRSQIQQKIQTEARSEVEKALVQREAQVLYSVRNIRIDAIDALAKRLKEYIKDGKLDDSIENKDVLDLLKQINIELGNNTDNIKVSLADGSLRDKLKLLGIE